MQTVSNVTVTSIRRKDNHSQKIIALGDSLVYGYGDPIGGGWVEQLRRKWMSCDRTSHVLYNLGIRGDRVIQVSERLEQEFRYRGELKNRFPDVIILSVGVNDSARLGRLNGRLFTEEEEFTRLITNLLERAKQLCPEVLFVGMVPVDESKMPFQNCLYYNHCDQYRYKEVTKQACEARQIPYLDLFDKWIAHLPWRSLLCSDGLHPNVEGYQAILQEVLNWEPIAKLSLSDSLNSL